MQGGQVGAIRSVYDAVTDAFGELQAGQLAFFQLQAILRKDRQLNVRQPGRVTVLRIANLLDRLHHHPIAKLIVDLFLNGEIVDEEGLIEIVDQVEWLIEMCEINPMK